MFVPDPPAASYQTQPHHVFPRSSLLLDLGGRSLDGQDAKIVVANGGGQTQRPYSVNLGMGLHVDQQEGVLQEVGEVLDTALEAV